MALEHVLLGILRRPSSGYDIKAHFDQVFRHFWAAELSQIYRTLKRMEDEGLLTSRAEPSAKGPAKRVYQVTAKGRQRLRQWLAAPELGDERLTYLSQVFFLDEQRDAAASLRFMRALREHFALRLAELEAVEAGWRADPRYPDALPDEEFHPQLTLALGLRKLAATVAWADESIARMEARARAEGA
jgi:DNA-binding PadR family transcriptional regulator